jgi:tRNA/rRNA methyltransferase
MGVMNSNFAVVLVRPEHPANIGLVARNMKNTGFDRLRLVGVSEISTESRKTAVHAGEILESAQTYDRLEQATADLDVVFAATSKKRKNFSCLSLKEAVDKMSRFSGNARVGLLFGNERTGLTSEELKYSNFRFAIPQATRQPSFNLASAVLVTLFSVFIRSPHSAETHDLAKPLPQKEQMECIEMILRKLEKKRFIHKTNKRHMTETIYDLFGRLGITENDKKLLMAIFSKGADTWKT